MKNVPKLIYLQVGEDATDEDVFQEMNKVTWASDKVFNTDIPFVLLQTDVLCCKAFIEQLMSKLEKAADSEENDFKRDVINSKIGDLYTAMKVINEHSAL